MAEGDDWGYCAEVQEKQILLLRNLSINSPKSEMAEEDDWGYCAEVQEKSLSSLRNHCMSFSKSIHSSLNMKTAASSNSVPEVRETENDEPELDAIYLMKKLLRSYLRKATSDIGIQQINPDSLLYSLKSFDELNLDPALLKGVYSMGVDVPSKIQETEILPTLIADPPQNMISQLQSGIGKTAAFVLASLSRVDTTLKYPHVLVLTHMYELALQTGKVAQKMAQFCPNIKFRYAVRGEHVDKGSKFEQHFLIGTPGKVFSWAMRYKFFDLKKIKVFVVDEASIMMSSQGYHDQIIRIHKQLPKDCQMMLFYDMYSTDIMEFAEMLVQNPIIKLNRVEAHLENIEQYYVVCETKEDKYQIVVNIYGTISIGQVVIFCHTKKTARMLAEKMSKDGLIVGLLSDESTFEQREAVFNHFQEGNIKVLFATDLFIPVILHVIDMGKVIVVINFDLPVNQACEADCESYLYRMSLTGRYGKPGLAVNVVDGKKSRTVLHQIEDYFGKKIKKVDANEIDDLKK